MSTFITPIFICMKFYYSDFDLVSKIVILIWNQSPRIWFWFWFSINFHMCDFDFDLKSFSKWSFPTLAIALHANSASLMRNSKEAVRISTIEELQHFREFREQKQRTPMQSIETRMRQYCRTAVIIGRAYPTKKTSAVVVIGCGCCMLGREMTTGTPMRSVYYSLLLLLCQRAGWFWVIFGPGQNPWQMLWVATVESHLDNNGGRDFR